MQSLLAIMGFGAAFSCDKPEKYPPVLYGPPVEYDDSTDLEQPAEVKPMNEDFGHE